MAAAGPGSLGEPRGTAVTATFGDPIIAFAPDSTYLASAERNSAGCPAVDEFLDLTRVPWKPPVYQAASRPQAAVSSLSRGRSTRPRWHSEPSLPPPTSTLHGMCAPQLNTGRYLTDRILCLRKHGEPCQGVESFAFQP